MGHNSKAVHIAYAKRAQVTVASLEDYEEIAAKKVVQVEFARGFPLCQRRGLDPSFLNPERNRVSISRIVNVTSDFCGSM